MTLVRTFQVLRDQWWVVVLVALLGAGVATGAAEWRNRSLEPNFEAIAPLTVLRLPEEKDDRFDRRVSTVITQARSTVRSQLVDSEMRVEEGEAGGVVNFVATAFTSDEALANATGLRRAYLDSLPAATAEEQLNPILDSIIEEVEIIEQQLADLRGTPTSDPVIEAQRSALLSRMGSTVEESASLEALLLDPDLTEEERIEAEDRLESLEDLIETLETRLEELPPGETTAIDSPATRLEILVLERRLRNLESRYVASAVQQSEAGTEGLVGEPSVIDLTSAEISRTLAFLVGLAAGVLVSGVGVLGIDRLQRPVRSSEDVSGVPVVALDRRKERSDSTFEWYHQAHEPSRRAAIQALRANLDRLSAYKIVVVTGVGTLDGDVQQLATDLGGAVAASGRKVFLIDANFDNQTGRIGSDATLADMLASQDDSVPDPPQIKHLLDERAEVTPNLLVVPAGPIASDPVDALAGAAFKQIVVEAAELADVVILSAPAVGTPGGDAIAIHSRVALLVAERKRTRREDVLESVGHLEDANVTVAAVALISGAVRLKSVPARGKMAARWRPRAAGTHKRRSPTDGQSRSE
jgi:Mrp family chromosome partitioning ATPase